MISLKKTFEKDVYSDALSEVNMQGKANKGTRLYLCGSKKLMVYSQGKVCGLIKRLLAKSDMIKYQAEATFHFHE